MLEYRFVHPSSAVKVEDCPLGGGLRGRDRVNRPAPVLARGDVDSGSFPTWGISPSGVQGEVVEAAADALSSAVVLVGAAQAHDRGHQPAHQAHRDRKSAV